MPDKTIALPCHTLPVTDPTLLTTRQILHEISILKELVFTKLNSSDVEHKLIQSVVETRLDGMDKATGLVQNLADNLPSKIDEKVAAAHQIQEEKFKSIQIQFIERDVRMDQSSNDQKVAIAAALAAVKEAGGKQNESSDKAVAKSETATSKQMDQIMQLIVSGREAMDDKLNDVKERLTRVEGNSEGKLVANTSHHTNNSFTVQATFAIIAFASLVLATVVAIWK